MQAQGMNRHCFFPTFLILLLTIIVTACGASPLPESSGNPIATGETSTAPIQLTDGLGRQVTLADSAQRIVSLAPSNTEILFALGCGGQVVGRDEFSDYPPEALELPSVGGSYGGYDQEAIVALHPDLILAAQINTPEQVQSLANLGLTVYYLANPLDFNGLYANLRTVAELCGHSREAETLIASLQERVQTVEDALAGVTQQPLVFYELDGGDPAKPWTAGPTSFMTYLIHMAGGRSVGEALTGDYAQISLEELLVQDPDLILLGDSAYGTTAEQVGSRSGWAGLSAVQDGRIFPFNDDLVSLPGPRWVDGLEALVGILHPEIMK
jgi:iron complex transport system substrate-binding protein